MHKRGNVELLKTFTLLLKVSDNCIADALKYVCIVIRMFHLHINTQILLSRSLWFSCKAAVRTYSMYIVYMHGDI